MSDTQAFQREHFGAGEQQSAGWPFHRDYGVEHPADEGIEAELTAGFRVEPGREYGFLTDTTLCIGCKACEVACKQWNNLPADEAEFLGTSYDNTLSLGHSTWRHVKFIEQKPAADPGADRQAGEERIRPRSGRRRGPVPGVARSASPRWLFQSDICKHCAHAGCLEACPTGAIIRTEFGTVLIQQEICNGCNYCVPSCPYGVITVGMEADGKAHKCTLCYDRLKGGMEPACAKACPTDSIQFGPLDALRPRAQARVEALHSQGFSEAQLYGDPGGTGATNGIQSLNSFFLLMDHPNVYNLPEAPTLPSRNIVPGLLASLATATVLIGAVGRALGVRR